MPNQRRWGGSTGIFLHQVRKFIYITLVLSLAASVHATTWYLNGNLATGLNNGTSPANAWQTLGAVVVTSFANNDTLLIMGYDYSLQTTPYHTPSGK